MASTTDGCKCGQNKMVPEEFSDPFSSSNESRKRGLKCQICGDRIDPVIQKNRLASQENKQESEKKDGTNRVLIILDRKGIIKTKK